jgi:hypothetical protein
MFEVRFMTLSGSFAAVKTERFADMTVALTAVKAYVEPAGFRGVKIVDDTDSIRFTATTPGGRGGRNVAFAYELPESEQS